MQTYHSVKNYSATLVGSVSLGIDGSDQFWLVKNNEDEINAQDVERAFLERVYRDTDVPGGYFCHNVTVTQLPHRNECIAIVHHRYDV